MPLLLSVPISLNILPSALPSMIKFKSSVSLLVVQFKNVLLPFCLALNEIKEVPNTGTHGSIFKVRSVLPDKAQAVPRLDGVVATTNLYLVPLSDWEATNWG